MLEHVAADIGHHPLAEPVDAVEARGARQREDEADADERGEIFVDQAGLDAGEAEIDHAPDGKRHGERGGSRDEKGEQSGAEHALVAQEIGPEREQRAKRGALASVSRSASLWAGACLWRLAPSVFGVASCTKRPS